MKNKIDLKPSTYSQFLEKLRIVIKSVTPFLIFLLFYGMNKTFKIQPSLEDLNCVHVHTINIFESLFFSFKPHKIISAYHSTALDILSCIPYLIHYSIPVIYPIFLLLTRRFNDIPKFYWLLGWMMWTSYLIWLIFPVAPPWVLDHMISNDNNENTSLSTLLRHREGCAFRRVDMFFGSQFFFNLFQGNPAPYGAFPSGHVAWPTCIYLTSPPGGNIFILYIVYMAWATLYSCHHYLTDAIFGVIIACIVDKVIRYLRIRNVCRYQQPISSMSSYLYLQTV